MDRAQVGAGRMVRNISHHTGEVTLNTPYAHHRTAMYLATAIGRPRTQRPPPAILAVSQPGIDTAERACAGLRREWWQPLA